MHQTFCKLFSAKPSLLTKINSYAWSGCARDDKWVGCQSSLQQIAGTKQRQDSHPAILFATQAACGVMAI